MANTGAFWSRTQECPWRLQSCPAQHPSPPRGFCPGSRVWTDAHQGDTLRRQPMDRSQRRTECPGKRALHTQVAAGQPQSACWVRAESGPVGAPCEDERRSQGSECSLLITHSAVLDLESHGAQVTGLVGCGGGCIQGKSPVQLGEAPRECQGSKEGNPQAQGNLP